LYADVLHLLTAESGPELPIRDFRKLSL